ncbi:MAG: DUF87 domain-containing protein [Cyanobacteria bacterium J06560_2]
MAENYEQLGKFYLGKEYSLEEGEPLEPLVLYDSPDLTTHAMIVGMTGSGKTGLGISLLEEALMDNIPLIAVDPKGDLANLLLTFNPLTGEALQPWVNAGEAAAQGMTLAEYARSQANVWKQGLGQWGQTADRIGKMRSQSELAVYTPGSSAGLPISVLRSFNAPPESVMADGDLRREQVQSTVTSLLTLLSIEADPVTSREHILLSNILNTVWNEGENIDLAGLIQAIQTPPFEKIGVMTLDTFYPAKERFGLAMQLNSLLAAPGFDAWMQGEPLDIQQLLYTPEGKARAAIFSTAHLSDRERMFFTTMLLNALLGWMRIQSGTSSLRALFYMDEIFGYLPPVANPPSKQPFLTLLKQARAFGLGLVLSTQNPVDLDYKALSNMGTWFIGRLQTERDKARLMEGLRGATNLETTELETVLSQLGKRVFLLHNVHEDRPVIFQTRWTMSYLRGPLTRAQIKQLKQPKRQPKSSSTKTADPKPTAPQQPSAEAAKSIPAVALASIPPASPEEINTYFLAAKSSEGVEYQPAVVISAAVGYESKAYRVDNTRQITLVSPLKTDSFSWERAVKTTLKPAKLKTAPSSPATFLALPELAQKAATFKRWEREFAKYVREQEALTLFACKSPKLIGTVDEDRAAFVARLQHHQRELRDAAISKLQQRYANRLKAAENKLARAEQTIENKATRAQRQQMNSAIAIGTTVLGAFMGRKMNSRYAVNSAGRAMRNVSRIGQSRQDMQQAKDQAERMRDELLALEGELQQELSTLEAKFSGTALPVETVEISPKSNNIVHSAYGLLWLPYRQNEQGKMSPDW